jgi:hypothetical protein
VLFAASYALACRCSRRSRFAGLSPYVAKLISDTACFFFNFLIMRVWVYRPRDPEAGEAGQSPPPRSERHGRFAV